MKNILAIFERDFKSYFTSPIAYVVLTIFVLLAGLFYTNIFTAVVEQSMMQGMRSQQMGQPPQPIDVPSIVARSYFGTLSVVLLFMIPMITMGLFSEEKKRGTIELLLTSPLTNLQVVLGKFFAGLAFFCCMLGLSMLLIGTLFIYSKPDFGPIFSGYLGLLLYGASLVALGMFVSTLTENQIIAAVLGFGMILILWIVDAFAGSTGTVMQQIISYLSVIQHLEDFIKGVVDTPGIIFYISLAIFGIVLTYRSVESYRWRG